MKLITKSIWNKGLYHLKMKNNKRIIENINDLFESDGQPFPEYSLAVKFVLLIALKENTINKETAELEFAVIREYWQMKPDTEKLDTQK